MITASSLNSHSVVDHQRDGCWFGVGVRGDLRSRGVASEHNHLISTRYMQIKVPGRGSSPRPAKIQVILDLCLYVFMIYTCCSWSRVFAMVSCVMMIMKTSLWCSVGSGFKTTDYVAVSRPRDKESAVLCFAVYLLL